MKQYSTYNKLSLIINLVAPFYIAIINFIIVISYYKDKSILFINIYKFI